MEAMEFRLCYRGPLRANGRPAEKQALRRHFHKQLATLWRQDPLAGQAMLLLNPEAFQYAVPVGVGPFTFAPLVSSRLHGIAELDILFLRPQRPGEIISRGGDLDNRIKTLLDALQVPPRNEVPDDDVPGAGETPLYCLLEDHMLVTRLNVMGDQLLDAGATDEVLLVIHVSARQTHTANTFYLGGH